MKFYRLILSFFNAIAIFSASAQTSYTGNTTVFNNWDFNSISYDGTNTGLSFNWENTLTNFAAQTSSNQITIVWSANTNYTIGHGFLYNEPLSLGNIDPQNLAIRFEAELSSTINANWSPLMAVQKDGETSYYRQAHTSNIYNGSDPINLYLSLGEWKRILPTSDSFASNFNPDVSPTDLEGATLLFGFIQWGAATSSSLDTQPVTTLSHFQVSLSEPKLQMVTLNASSGTISNVINSNSFKFKSSGYDSSDYYTLRIDDAGHGYSGESAAAWDALRYFQSFNGITLDGFAHFVQYDSGGGEIGAYYWNTSDGFPMGDAQPGTNYLFASLANNDHVDVVLEVIFAEDLDSLNEHIVSRYLHKEGAAITIEEAARAFSPNTPLSLERNSGSLTLKWNEIIGNRYTPQSTDDLTPGNVNWTNERAESNGTGAEESITIPIDRPSEFLRVRQR